jgi:hypothetical protein
MLFTHYIRFACVKKFMKKFPKNEVDHVGYISYCGRIDIIKAIRGLPKNRFNTAVYWAIHEGRLDIVRYLYFIGIFPLIHKEVIYAAQNGHVSVLKFLYSINIPITPFLIENAMANGHKKVVRFLRSI